MRTRFKSLKHRLRTLFRRPATPEVSSPNPAPAPQPASILSAPSTASLHTAPSHLSPTPAQPAPKSLSAETAPTTPTPAARTRRVYAASPPAPPPYTPAKPPRKLDAPEDVEKAVPAQGRDIQRTPPRKVAPCTPQRRGSARRLGAGRAGNTVEATFWIPRRGGKGRGEVRGLFAPEEEGEKGTGEEKVAREMERWPSFVLV